jgi:hypothetical protein
VCVWQMYQALIDERIVSTYHQSKATIDAKVGGKFVLFEGTIRGEFVELVSGCPLRLRLSTVQVGRCVV